MGEEVATAAYTREARARYREKVHQDLDVFEQMLTHHSFDFERPPTGMEIELNLVDEDYRPRMNNAAVLERIADPRYQTQLAQYNIELNVEPRLLPGDTARNLEEDLRQSLNRAEALANETGAHIVQIGILPTVMPEHFQANWMSANLRYAALNEAMVNARGEDMFIDIRGAAVNASPCTPTRSVPSPPVRQCSCTCRCPRRSSLRAGTPLRHWPACSWR